MTRTLRYSALALLSATVLPLLSTSPASAVLVTVGGNVYDVTASTMTYEMGTSAFQAPPCRADALVGR
jgi:hypothetical protein